MHSVHVSADPKDRDLTLPCGTFAYDYLRDDTAGFSPFYLLCAREPTLPLATLVPLATTPPTEYVFEAVSRATLARAVARARLSASQASQKTCYDLKHRNINYRPASMVSFSPCGPLRKTSLALPWPLQGPAQGHRCGVGD